MAITKLALNGKEYNIGMEGPQMYEGRDLAAYTWDDLKNMSRDGDYSDIRVGDFKEIQVGKEKVIMEIAGIDTHYNTGWTEVHGDYDTTALNPVPHHIDWISRDCLNDLHQWNLTATNNAVFDEEQNPDKGTDVPWLQSHIYQDLETIYEKLPQEVKDVIINKINILERRGHQQGVGQDLTESTGWHWYPMGRLWLPSEYEVFGTNVWGQKGYGSTQAVQYPLFANSWKHRIKGK